MFKNLKMCNKISLPICSAVIIIFTLTLSLIIQQVRSNTIADATEISKQVAINFKEKAKKMMNTPIRASEYLRDAFEAAILDWAWEF